MRIRVAARDELPILQDIEIAAGRCFRDVGMGEIAGDDPLSVEELDGYRAAGHAWVAVGSDDEPIAYLIAKPVDGNLHVEQVSVHPRHARYGVGRALIDHAAKHAADRGMPALTLTTFAEVPWNAPYYARIGFTVLDEADAGPDLRAIRAHEAAHGLDRWPRVCMVRAA